MFSFAFLMEFTFFLIVWIDGTKCEKVGIAILTLPVFKFTQSCYNLEIEKGLKKNSASWLDNKMMEV